MSTANADSVRLCEHGVAEGFGCSGCTLIASFATDIAIWLRVHSDNEWVADNEAVQLLAARLVRHVKAAQIDGAGAAS